MYLKNNRVKETEKIIRTKTSTFDLHDFEINFVDTDGDLKCHLEYEKIKYSLGLVPTEKLNSLKRDSVRYNQMDYSTDFSKEHCIEYIKKYLLNPSDEYFPVIYSSYGSSFYLPKTKTWHESVPFSYLNGEMDNGNYDLKGVLEHLKTIDDPNLFFQEELGELSIPYFNRLKSLTHYVQFEYCWTLEKPRDPQQSWKTIQEIKEYLGIERFKK